MNYSVGDSPAHASDQANRTPSTTINHFLSNRLSRCEDTRDVHFENAVKILSCEIQGITLLVDTCCCNEAIQTSVLVRNIADYLPDTAFVGNIDLSIVKCCA